MSESKTVTMGDLFDYVEKKCDFHQRPGLHGKTTWTCYGDFRFTEEFCKAHNLDFEAVKEMLEGNGGYCDCEIIFNVVDDVSRETPLSSEEIKTTMRKGLERRFPQGDEGNDSS